MVKEKEEKKHSGENPRIVLRLKVFKLNCGHHLATTTGVRMPTGSIPTSL
jgi:hypothetical protein